MLPEPKYRHSDKEEVRGSRPPRPTQVVTVDMII
jgi:hypothetical protein